MKHQLFQILEEINKNANLNQKKLAELCGISIGKINYIIHDLTFENYIYSEKKGRNISYYLTRKGLDYLKEGIRNYQEKKIIIHQEPLREIHQAVILAAGQRKDFDKPAGLMPIEGKSLLERNIEILQECGIHRIIIVIGYKQDAFQELVEFNQITYVNNPKYKWTGSMASLAMAYEYITDDFLLMEDDILIEERAIKQLISDPQRDSILITNEGGSGDEAFVEIKNGYLHKISKDIHQFNKVDGEMIGVSKLSYDLFGKMVSEFHENNQNPYMNYEYMLLDVSRQYNVGYLKIHDLVWAEVDNQHHYEVVTKNIYPILKRKEAEFRELQIKGYLIDALDFDVEDILDIQPFGGMTNKNFKVVTKDKDYVLRIPGNGTEEMINRKEEKINLSLASDIGLDSELVYFNDESGIKISELIRDAETLNSKTAKREDYMGMTTSILRKLHQSNAIMANRFNVFDEIVRYERLIKEAGGKPYEHYEEVKAHLFAVKEKYEAMNITLAPCHNDTVPENFVKSGDRLYLIDWEYSGMNDPMWDLAAHSLECGFSPEDEELFITLYLNKEIIPYEIQQRVLLNKIFQDFLWSIWTVIKEAKGDNFGSYGIDRFNRARTNLNHTLVKELICQYEN